MFRKKEIESFNIHIKVEYFYRNYFFPLLNWSSWVERLVEVSYPSLSCHETELQIDWFSYINNHDTK